MGPKFIDKEIQKYPILSKNVLATNEERLLVSFNNAILLKSLIWAMGREC